MARPAPDDPFFWDTDRVCQELCSDGAEWTNDVSSLESLLRDNLMDGETLLTYELVFSRKELLECLEITAARYRHKLIRKIMHLQKQSPQYHKEKKILENDQGVETFELPQTPTASVPSPARTRHTPVISTPPRPSSITTLESQTAEEHPSKRRRIVPTFIKAVLPDNPTPRMPGFEEPEPPVTRKIPLSSASLPTEDLPTAYLGNTAVAEPSIIPLDAQYDSDSASDTFQSTTILSQPRGKTKAIYSMVKRYLVKNNRKVAKIQLGIQTGTASDGDDIINIDELASSLDEDTLREIADEEDDNQESKPCSLNPETVEEIINEEIAKAKAFWEEKKLPKCESKAYQLWTRARKHSLLRQQFFTARKQAEHCRTRLSNLTRDLRGVPWATNEELRFQTRVLEQTVHEKLHQEWLTQLFSQRTAPPKPPPTNIAAAQKRHPQRRKKFVHNDELLSSSEEELLEDFIVPDEDSAPTRGLSPTLYHGALSPAPNASSPRSPSSSAIKLAASQFEEVIDLTMGSDAEAADNEGEMVHNTFDPFTYEALEEIGKTSPRAWAKQNDRFRLAISMLWRLDFDRREAVFQSLTASTLTNIWLELIEQAYVRLDEGDKTPAPDAILDLTILFLNFSKCRYYNEQKLYKMKEKDLSKLEDSEQSFAPFCSFIKEIKDAFPQKNQIASLDDFDEELDAEDGLPDDAADATSPSKKAKKKPRIMDREGVALRERDRQRAVELELRKNELRATLENTNAIDTASAQAPRFIINESKADDQGFIYVHPAISSRIKDHQIEGVRFMWNHIVQEESERQGCLLAHTMGLGKTMQTITFLVALRESALSKDPGVRDQIPKDLRNWKVLVICPSGLVENWRDEFEIWAPPNLLGPIITIEAAQGPNQRLDNAKDWAKGGGVLIIGYTMVKSGFGKGDQNTPTIDKIVTENATVVIADEAHSLKNPKAKITRVASALKTGTRIALTGSPLANNVEEYYAMINWVAPNYLGPLQEFRDMYATPIHQGLYNDSSNYEKRKAIKLLQVLKTTAAPKVHRATINSCLRDELPPKEEFVISVPPTQMQRRLYDLYMQSCGSKVNQANLFGILNHLALICAHPAAYRKQVIELNTKSELGQDFAKFPMDTIPKIMKITDDPKLERTELSYKVELLNKILDQSKLVGDKVLVFSQSIATLNYLATLFGKQQRPYCRLDGSTNIAKRQDMVKRFNKGVEEVYLISTNAGGVGLNIYGANRVIIFDFKWNPVSDQQAIGRAYRIGQTKPVFVYRFVVAGSFEEDLQNKAVFKMQLASRVVDQKNVVSWSKRLANLMHTIRDVDASDARFDFKGKDTVLDHILDYDNSRAILSIMSSDAFEEEDETATLTAEESQEAQSMVERHKLRMTDPEKYSRLVDAEKIASNQRPTSHIASGKPNKDWFPERPSHAYKTVLPSNYMAPLTTSPANASTPMPILGANTYYGSSGVGEVAPNNTSVLPSNGPSLFTETSSLAAQNKFEHRLATALTSVEARLPGCGLNAPGMASSFTAAIRAARVSENTTLSSDELRWNTLCGKLNNQVFVLSLASGQISASFIALTPDAELNARLQSLENLGEEQLWRNIQQGGKPKDPEVRLTDQQHVPHPQEEEESKD